MVLVLNSVCLDGIETFELPSRGWLHTFQPCGLWLLIFRGMLVDGSFLGVLSDREKMGGSFNELLVDESGQAAHPAPC